MPARTNTSALKKVRNFLHAQFVTAFHGGLSIWRRMRVGRAMNGNDVTIFKPYEFVVGEKITIEGGPRRGDWEIIGLSERKLKLRCPVSRREFEWDRFCYHVEKRKGIEWPHRD
jgi:hypothetical protein